jgi:hypothetical protein
MFNRLKRAVVESYVGAIALGYLFAQGMFRFVNIFASPVGVRFSPFDLVSPYALALLQSPQERAIRASAEFRTGWVNAEN